MKAGNIRKFSYFGTSEEKPKNLEKGNIYVETDTGNIITYNDAGEPNNPVPEVTGPKVFRGLITQNATFEPELIILENTLGINPVFTRTDIGIYKTQDLGFTDTEKVFTTLFTNSPAAIRNIRAGFKNGVGNLEINTYDRSADQLPALSDQKMNLTPIEILIYD